MQDNNPGFFDKRNLFAVLIVAMVYGGWQYYLSLKYPGYGQKNASQEVSNEIERKALPSNSSDSRIKNSQESSSISPSVAIASNKMSSYSGDSVEFDIQSQGMALTSVNLKNFKDATQNHLNIVSDGFSIFGLELQKTGQMISFEMTEKGPGMFEGLAFVEGAQIKNTLKYDSLKNAFFSTIAVDNRKGTAEKHFQLVYFQPVKAEVKKSWLFPSYDVQEFFLIHGDEKKENININHATENYSHTFKNGRIFSLGSPYFGVLMKPLDFEPTFEVGVELEKKRAIGKTLFPSVAVGEEKVWSQILYVGPKSTTMLSGIHEDLVKTVDFGMFGFIATPLLHLMKFFYSLVFNWGWAIILLTLLVRLAVLPFNIMSFKSMKAMQKIQPRIQSLKEKFKEDPIRLNQEMMSLMKESGANPLGGCLPMFLQIPIFFALYRVISSSVELYQSPFIFWIKDLSSHDPFYILPVIMAAAMYVQQKMTPTTMDPAQARIMTFLPVIMCVFMLQLPSGLTLYMCVSTLFGLAQQFLLMRERG